MSVAAIFQDAARTASSHRKNVVALRKIHLRKGHALEPDFCRCVARILPAKKGYPEAERIILFLAAYLEGFKADGDDGAGKAILDGLVAKLLNLVLRGFKAKDKNVRFRTCQIVWLLLNHLEELDDATFCLVRDELFIRSKDKEAAVRTQAASAISRLQDVGDEEEDDLVRECLLNMLQHDTSVDVRKAVLWNISVNSITLPYILERARDVDPNVRKLAFRKIMEDVEKMGMIPIEDRDMLLNSGLSDREANVQKAAVAMLCERWIPECGDKMLNLLHKMDVMSGGAAESAAKAYMLSVTNSSDDSIPPLKILYDEETWNNLDVEEAFFLRTAITFFSENQMHDELEDALPPLLKHSEFLQRYGLLLAQTEDEDEAISLDFILRQLLLIAEVQDYADEMGRRDLLLILRDMLSSLDLRKENILIIVRIMKSRASSESDFTRMIIEVLYTIYDIEGSESQDMKNSPRRPEDVTEKDIERSILMLKCMDVICCVLECAEANLQENVSMAGILDTFVLPSLTSPHPATNYAALQCLSLACLLDKALAQRHIQLFMSAFTDQRTELSSLALKVFFDLSVLFGPDLLLTPGLLTEVISETLQCDDEDLLTLAVEGSAKLMMLSFMSDELVLQQIIVLYYHPHTRNMNRLRQCLSYFLPVFAHAAHANQALLQTVIVPSLRILAQEYVESKDSMVAPLLIGGQLIDWIDVRRVVRAEGTEESAGDEMHALLALELLELAKEEQDLATEKLWCQLLSKLHLADCADAEKLTRIAEATSALIRSQPKGSASLLSLKKFARAVAEIDERALQQATEDEFLDQQTLITAMSELRIQMGADKPGTDQ
ncbi:hypothetical protein HDU86_001256 [Geranomyces michiganensis]|nr:hypothetical protein HDU86_001256 [Geranomyces michiganensis]